jgi:hypothetical protein
MPICSIDYSGHYSAWVDDCSESNEFEVAATCRTVVVDCREDRTASTYPLWLVELIW